jgi:hypothetical protein
VEWEDIDAASESFQKSVFSLDFGNQCHRQFGHHIPIKNKKLNILRGVES